MVNCNISQACKEEIESRLDSEALGGAQTALEELYQALEESKHRPWLGAANWLMNGYV